MKKYLIGLYLLCTLAVAADLLTHRLPSGPLPAEAIAQIDRAVMAYNTYSHHRPITYTIASANRAPLLLAHNNQPADEQWCVTLRLSDQKADLPSHAILDRDNWRWTLYFSDTELDFAARGCELWQ